MTGFVQRAREELQAYNVPISIDVFGYAMQVRRAEGIGQDFDKMANQTDVMSSMIYPSHWGSWSFDIEKPDLEPYELVSRYLEEEKKIFNELEHPPVSRPWIQDFTASWIGEGNWMEYDGDAVQAQIDAIYDQGLNEYLIWNANSEYSSGVDY
ncbi:putative glycoside hydrolase [Anaerococcus cruorum]|uniref:putative glycoside hydrolase n=1 Tax=Anaerococcus sp. WGS1596 TaxID=3366806 RepID=UPI00372D3AEE